MENNTVKPLSSDELVKLSFFANMGKSIVSAATLKDTLTAVMKQIGEVFAPLNWSLFLRDFKTGDLKFALVIGSGVEHLRGKVLPRGTGIAGWIAENGQALIIDDVRKDPRFCAEIDGFSGFVTKSIIGVPLISRNRVFGVIELINKLNGDSFAPLDLKMLTTIADFAAIAIEKAYYLSALKRLAATDELTGLLNRRGFLKVLERENERCRRFGTSYTILLLDIDDFKKINDRLGHAEGDRVLRRFAAVLKSHIRTVDTPCRLGGDEFIVLMPDTTLQAGQDVRKRIQKALEEDAAADIARFSVSAGLHEGNIENFDQILNRVDADMYREKVLRTDQTLTNLSENLETMIDEE